MAVFETGMQWYRHFVDTMDMWQRRRFFVMRGTRIQLGWCRFGEKWRADNDN
jgi:hypothetical protein